MEIWKEIDGFGKKYFVSNYGNIKNKKGKILKQQKERYYRICLYDDNNKQKMISVHRLVAKAFVPNPSNKPCVNHIDENQYNNYYSNLEWVTIAENNEHGTRKLRSSITQGKTVIQYDKEGKLLNTYHSVREAGRQIGKSLSSILRCCNKKSSIAYGYKWRYKEEVT